MHAWDLDRYRMLSERVLEGEDYDFSAKFLALGELESLSRVHPERIRPGTVEMLERILKSRELAGETQAFFFYQAAARTLASLLDPERGGDLSPRVLTTFKNLLTVIGGRPLRATAEALGNLPLPIGGPSAPPTISGPFKGYGWSELLLALDLEPAGVSNWVGRSLVTPLPGGELLVLKMARPADAPAELANEAYWLRRLGPSRSGAFGVLSLHLPEGLDVEEAPVFRLLETPVPAPPDLSLHPEGLATAFRTTKDYYVYANDPRPFLRPGSERFKEIMTVSARTLGTLTAAGIIHEALIPLFHNRLQAHRRNDHGLYEWPRAGRLDRWLESCAHPNVGLTGIRDLEHLAPFRKRPGRSLYFEIGTHFLSLLLIIGSYFRSSDPGRRGLQPDGQPVDARDAFEPALLSAAIDVVFRGYYEGFVGAAYEGRLPFDLHKLAGRMIEEMGVDRHMNEVLRIHDQDRMGETEFRAFLRARGFNAEQIRENPRGRHDIVIHSGPHLGGFNEQISLPELIETLAVMSAVCVADRYWWGKTRVSLRATHH